MGSIKRKKPTANKLKQDLVLRRMKMRKMPQICQLYKNLNNLGPKIRPKEQGTISEHEFK